MRETLHIAEGSLRGYLGRCVEEGRHPPHLTGLRVDYDHAYLRVIFCVEFAGVEPLQWLVDANLMRHEARDQPWNMIVRELEQRIRSMYSRIYEDELVRREAMIARLQFDEFARTCPDRQRVLAAHYELEQRLQHVRRYHREHHGAPTVIGVDRARPGSDRSAVASYRGREITVMAFDELVPPEVDLALMRGLSERVDRSIWEAFGGPPDTGEAERKGLALLREWLSPEQLAQYDKAQHFDVVGSNSGKRYRIHHGRQQNIKELDAKGREVCGWCFLPEGQLVAGDVMLGQKIALETNETRALKVANRFNLSLDMRPGAVNRYVGVLTWI